MTSPAKPPKCHPDCLVLFTRFPVPGKTKTRLIPLLGPHGAADLQRKMTERIFHECQKMQSQNVSCIIHYRGESVREMQNWLGDQIYSRQTGEDLGENMRQGFLFAAQKGAERILLIGSDIPELSMEILKSGFAELHKEYAVLGPSRDGGFYAIGLTAIQARKLLPDLFLDTQWSTSRVFTEIAKRLRDAGCTPMLLPMLSDIDRPEDLQLAVELGLVTKTLDII
jgi:hypothetical protein